MKVIDIDMHIHWETTDAWLLSLDGDSKNAKWLPKSKIELQEGDLGNCVVTIPEWLAVEKELV